MTAAILDHHGVAALAFDQRGDIGLTEVAPENQQITLPVAELRSIGNEIRALADPAVQRDRAVAGLPERRGRRAGISPRWFNQSGLFRCLEYRGTDPQKSENLVPQTDELAA